MQGKEETNQGNKATTICPVCNKSLVYAPENLVDYRTYYYCSCCDWYREVTGTEKDCGCSDTSSL